MKKKRGEPRMKIGDSVEISKKITEEDVRKFIEISGDDNPVHVDDEFAKRTMFKGRIVHGLIPLSLVSAALTKLMGPGNIWLSQTVKFNYPVRIGDVVRVRITVTGIRENGVHMIKTEAHNQNDKLVFDGESTSRVMFIKD
jgi:acyl dehydratase